MALQISQDDTREPPSMHFFCLCQPCVFLYWVSAQHDRPCAQVAAYLGQYRRAAHIPASLVASAAAAGELAAMGSCGSQLEDPAAGVCDGTAPDNSSAVCGGGAATSEQILRYDSYACMMQVCPLAKQPAGCDRNQGQPAQPQQQQPAIDGLTVA